MAQCAYCKTETELHDNGTPICVVCAGVRAVNPRSSYESKIRLKLLQEVRQTTDRVNAAAESFSLIMEDIPSNLPHPDSTSRITHASRELSAARAEMMVAHRRLNDFLSRGIIPENLKEDLKPGDSGAPEE